MAKPANSSIRTCRSHGNENRGEIKITVVSVISRNLTGFEEIAERIACPTGKKDMLAVE